MKNDLLNAFMHISMNGPPLHYKEEAALISRVSEQYALERHRIVSKLLSESINATSTSTQTEVTVDVDLSYENCLPSELESALDDMIYEQFLNSYFEYDDSSYDGTESDEDERIDPVHTTLFM